MFERRLPITRRLDQWILDCLVKSRGTGELGHVKVLGLRGIRKLRLLFSDPIVTFDLGGRTLQLPLSHDLPIYRSLFPEYAVNLGRVAYHVRRKYPELNMIDIGANVGDSVAIVRMYSDHPILCIEGEEGFFRLLVENARWFGEVELEQTFLGAEGDQVNAIRRERGNARITLGEVPGKFAICTLSEALSRHPRFANAKLLKLDAEGFDCRILAGESSFLTRKKPVLFFEYYPTCCELTGQEPFAIFAQLAEIGYSVVQIYQNVGHYLARLHLHQARELEDFHLSLAKVKGFCDIAAFHQEDLDIACNIQAQEAATNRISGGGQRRVVVDD